jgi:hypothetical protein
MIQDLNIPQTPPPAPPQKQTNDQSKETPGAGKPDNNGHKNR